MTSTITKITKFPVVEIFGPTIQGEGADQGLPCYFIRFGGCDYRCTWCDSPHAVLPHLVRQAPRLSENDVLNKLDELPRGPTTVILSGGNPALYELGSLVSRLQFPGGYKVALETQGTKWKDWMGTLDTICVSPKPPSSGMKHDTNELDSFMTKVSSIWVLPFIKIVIFNWIDYTWARKIHKRYDWMPMYLSAGNDAGTTVGDPGRIDSRSQERVTLDLITKGRWLANYVMVDEEMSDVKVQMQQHVLYWGNERGR